MTTSNIMVLVTNDHPLFDQLKAQDYLFFDLKTKDPFEERKTLKPEIIFDFTLLDHEKKEKLLKNLSMQFEAPLVSDLSCLWGEYFMEKFPNLIGAMAAAIWSPQAKVEVCAKNESDLSVLRDVLKSCNLELHSVKSAGHGFIYPRTISLLINEAYLAMEDELATETDLDTAMKYGVNYPLGLVEWSRKIGLKPVVSLLDDLFEKTKQNRYRASVSLRKLALLKS